MKFTNLKLSRSVLVAAVLTAFFSMMFAAGAWASSSVDTGNITGVKMNTAASTLTAKQISDIDIVELSVGSFSTSGNYFTLKIPSNVKLYTTASSSRSSAQAITRDTSTLGSSSSPGNLYLLRAAPSGATTAELCIKVNGTHAPLMKLYAATTGSAFYGDSASGYTSAGSFSAPVATPSWTLSDLSGYKTTDAVGQIYYDDTTSETVMSFAGIPDSNESERILLQGLTLIPAAPDTTGDVDLSLSDGNASAANGISVTDETFTVGELVDQAASVTGTASSGTVPTVKVGLANQSIGRLLITTVDSTGALGDSTITVALDNGAVFVSGATIASQVEVTTGSASATWENYANSGSSSEVVSGELVFTLGTSSTSRSWPDGSTLEIIAGEELIDATNASAGDISATVTGTGVFSSLSSTGTVVATAADAGVTVAKTETTTTQTIYTARTGEGWAASVNELRITEDSYGSLSANKTLTFALDQGVKFKTAVTGTQHTTSPYDGSSLSISDFAAPSSASATISTIVSTSSDSSGGKGAWDFNFDGVFDTTGASTGTLTLTVGGTAGAASDSITVATIMNATTTTSGSAVVTSAGAQDVALPDITVTENNAAALETGYIGFKFHSVTELDVSNATVTTTGGPSNGVGSSVTKGSSDDFEAFVQVTEQSNSTDGSYTIVISGLTANIASTASSGPLEYTVGGSTSDTYDSSAFDGDTGAKPFGQPVNFASVVSDTKPFADTPVVSGTVVTQTFVVAGNDQKSLGDIYVFTTNGAMYYDGSSWTPTATPLATSVTLGTHTVVYDVSSLVSTSSVNVFIGYGISGVTDTASNMQANNTHTLGYTVPAATAATPTPVGGSSGATVTESITANTLYDLTINVTNPDGDTPATIAHDWIAFQMVLSGTPTGLWLMTGSGSDAQQYVAGMDLTLVTRTIDHSTSTHSIGEYNLGQYMSSGDTLVVYYLYSTETDPTLADIKFPNILTLEMQ